VIPVVFLLSVFSHDGHSARPFSFGTVYPAPGVPFVLTFIGTAFSESELIGFGYAYEQQTQTRLSRKAFTAAIPTTQLKDVIGE
jgi:amidase